jgi:hypothetical protein
VIVCLDDDGRPNFHKLLFLRDCPWFFAFDLLALDSRDLVSVPDEASGGIGHRVGVNDRLPRLDCASLHSAL